MTEAQCDENKDPISHYNEKLSLNNDLVSQNNEKLFKISKYNYFKILSH